MSETKIINKNLDLSIRFNGFLIDNPDVAVQIESDSVIVFELKGNSVFNKTNWTLAKPSFESGVPCYKAEQTKTGWNICKVLAA